MMVQVLILLVGFFLLVKGADWFVEGAASIAKKLGIPQLVIGLTIVGNEFARSSCKHYGSIRQ